MLTELVDPLDRLLNFIASPPQRAGTQSNYSSATIVGVLSLGKPIVGLEMDYAPVDGRDGNARHLVKGGHGTGPSFEVATDDLIHDAQHIERAVASVLPVQRLEQIPREFDNNLSRHLMWFMQHALLSVPRISQ